MSGFYWASSLTGGGTGALDKIDGSDLADGDKAVVSITDTGMYCYNLNASSGETESSPNVISPDSNAGTKRWELEFFIPVSSSDNKGPKNKLINGNFDFWQRGTSFSATGYTADRWYFTEGSSNTTVVSRGSFTIGQTDVPGNPKYYLQLARTSTTSDDVLEQRIESAYTLAGETVTVSGYIKGTAAHTVDLLLRQNFGTTGSPSSDVDTASQEISVTTSWAKFELTFSLASISGKTLGTDDNDYLSAVFTLASAEGNDTFQLARVQVEKGSVATEFEERPIGTELALCQRYYQIIRYLFSGNVSSGSNYWFFCYVGVPFRDIPTVTFSSSVQVYNFSTASPTYSEVRADSISGYKAATGTDVGIYDQICTATAEL